MPRNTQNQDESTTDIATLTLPNEDYPDDSPGENVIREIRELEEPTPFIAKESAADTSVEQHKKALRSPGGVTRKNGAPPGSANDVPIKVPDPKYKTYYSDSDNPNQKTKAFWNWWNALPVVFKERCVAYVYRSWPVLIAIDKDESDELSNIDVISGMEPIQVDNDLNDKYGAGDFYIYFNEALKPGKRTLCRLYVKGSRDLKSRPPADRRINDPNQIEMTDPQNASYISFLRGRGILPDQITLAKKEGELASLQAAKEMSSTVERLTDKVISMAESKGKDAPGSDETLQLLTRASINVNEIQADAAKRSNEMLHETIKSMRELEGANGGNKSSASEMLALAIDLAKQFSGSRGETSEEVRELRATVERLRDDRMAVLEKAILEAKASPSANPSGSPFANLKDGFDAVRQMRELVDEMGGGSKDNPAEELAKASGAPAWLMPLLNVGLPILGNIVSAVTVSRGLATPGPVIQSQAPQQPQQPQQPIQMGPQQPQGGQYAATIGIPAPQGGQSMGAAPTTPQEAVLPNYGLPQDVAELLWEIKTPFTTAIVGGDTSGEDYADLFVGNYGNEIFKQVTSFGVEGLMSAVTNFPPITGRLNAMGIGVDRLTKFVTEFVGFKLDEGEGEDNNGTEPGPTTAA